MDVYINDELSIPEGELGFQASRSAGPGGQNVNKVNSRVTLRFDVAASPSLNDQQRRRIKEKLATRISGEGILQVSSQTERTQPANRKRSIERFADLLRDALRQRRPRKKTRVPRGVKERRLQEKKLRSLQKETRRKLE